MKILRFLLFLLFTSAGLNFSVAQVGGNGVFNVLRMPSSARQVALGGNPLAYADRGVGILSMNPGLANEEMHQRPFMNINTYLGKGWSGNAGYLHQLKSGIMVYGMAAYIDYGKMDAYDESGNTLGQISANETEFVAGAAYKFFPGFTAGGAFKVIYSVLGNSIGNGVALDMGAHYLNKDSTWSAGLALRNAGFMITPYTGLEREKLPFEVAIGASIKPKHMPARFHLALGNMQRFDITFNQYTSSGTIDLATGQAKTAKESTFLGKTTRHLSVGTELVFGKYFSAMVGYNHQRRQELAPSARKGLTGYSWGINFRLSKIQISYASAAYFPGFNMNLFTFSTRISEFRKKS